MEFNSFRIGFFYQQYAPNGAVKGFVKPRRGELLVEKNELVPFKLHRSGLLKGFEQLWL